jgi:hypothetical protein
MTWALGEETAHPSDCCAVLCNRGAASCQRRSMCPSWWMQDMPVRVGHWLWQISRHRHNTSTLSIRNCNVSAKCVATDHWRIAEAATCLHNRVPTYLLCLQITDNFQTPLTKTRSCATLKVKRTEATRRMAPSGMLRLVALVRTDVLEELSTLIIRVTRIGELGITLAVTINRSRLRRNSMEVPCSCETSVLVRTTRRNIPEGGILHSHRSGNLKSHKGISS